jgi:hypothetical protein
MINENEAARWSTALSEIFIGGIIVIVGSCLACFGCGILCSRWWKATENHNSIALTDSQGVEMKVILYKDAIDSGIIKGPSQVVELSGDVVEQSSL